MGHHRQMHAQREAGLVTSPQPPEARSSPWRAASRYPRTTGLRSARSALSSAQKDAWERLWPTLGAEATALSPSGAARLDTATWFGRDAPLVLEIGCGSGTSTLAMAKCEPGVNVIAVDVYRRGLAQLLSAIAREHVDNVRLIRGHALDVLERLIAPGSLTGVRVFFPDPWPKARHHKRRLLQPATIILIADRLRVGGLLHVATDHAGYAAQIIEGAAAEPRLCRVDPDKQPLAISVARPTTKYETKARLAGSPVFELLWERR
ncbi:tRNA (guanosine(46)-N7)-methyltransferase TrmB [Mycobacterium sp. SM1]|uniref:tRNA (guanosine(46)-N7)-methyltransferase TrmB n=1 Tax=Mycobacterium sp. SM1 TaxID=2816243 RepID=UPI001BCC0F36|nr:tRNA (guanosine(46)-N7)-methyltransferase TrmB [Mycobacterium sp. SM1]MBS4727825.1 tRNA (guanosine(46)-N7)-methyltransferase TrmB [Mycobacterium sp. SM1]